ncbi:four-carbon acid sugar kinase family protein [Puia sp. P3]|uniref:four-carbon acid sugar kinase family protein n=1 Tax=Puia sp. P3 TaxID=3423952 RepID=UPI003D66CB64
MILRGPRKPGGIGLRHGLTTEVRRAVPAVFDGALLVIATDTRSHALETAVAEMRDITSSVLGVGPQWVYKKTDSVLRGHVIAELRVQMEVLGFSRTLLIPANPVLGRTIVDGHYFLNGAPVNESAFAVDPDFPVVSSDVREMLGDSGVVVRKVDEELPDSGIVVGEVGSAEDLEAWAGRVVSGTLLAGASGFFDALLAMRRAPVLYVSGTTYWANKQGSLDVGVVVELLRGGKAFITGRKEELAEAVEKILSMVPVGELVIEGGSTAYAVLERLGIDRLVPERELAPGVVRMRAAGFYVTVKPGSYPWPDGLSY